MVASSLFHPLYIAKQQYATYSSDIDKNYASYGYVDIDSELHNSPVPNWQGKLMGATSKIINWRNQHMDFSKAMKLQKNTKVTAFDFERAISEVLPGFGMDQ